ncbi:MAG: hypothetical protein MPW14_01450 [Candidatus Manganitrophus sp.]|nr:MAG: hypothetical protein MPW14_01450 [Candidatus Manganitrophus sp.]
MDRHRIKDHLRQKADLFRNFSGEEQIEFPCCKRLAVFVFADGGIETKIPKSRYFQRRNSAVLTFRFSVVKKGASSSSGKLFRPNASVFGDKESIVSLCFPISFSSRLFFSSIFSTLSLNSERDSGAAKASGAKKVDSTSHDDMMMDRRILISVSFWDRPSWSAKSFLPQSPLQI